MKKVLITGGCGFAGHHLVDLILKKTDWNIVVIDNLSYASKGFDRLRSVGAMDNPRVRVFTLDLVSSIKDMAAKEIGRVDYLVHMGAETHVDNSIKDPAPFIYSNMVGTFNILEFVRHYNPELEMMLYFSTDEVFGPAPEGIHYKEWDRYNCTNPYSATKAAGEELSMSYANTFGLNISVIHCMNIFGEGQFPEKFIPLCINKALSGDLLSVHGSPEGVPGARHWIHAGNVAEAVLFLLGEAGARDKYNVVGDVEVNNLDIALKVASIVGKELNYEMVDFHSSRPGHDLRYALCGEKMKAMGWKSPRSFDNTFTSTVQWFLDNPDSLGE